MAETIKFYYHAPVVDGFDNEKFATSSIRLTKRDVRTPFTDPVSGEQLDDMKFTVCCERVQVKDYSDVNELSDAFKDRWNLDLQGVVDGFYAKTFTHPDYQGAAAEAMAAGDYEAAAKAAQQAIDEYKYNVKKERATVTKAEAAEVKGLKAKAAELGLSIEELIERASQL